MLSLTTINELRMKQPNNFEIGNGMNLRYTLRVYVVNSNKAVSAAAFCGVVVALYAKRKKWSLCKVAAVST